MWVRAWLARCRRPISEEPPRQARETARGALEGWGVAKLRSDPTLDLVVLGHTHIPTMTKVAPRRWYINAGDWVTHHSYLVLEEGANPRLLEWEVSDPLVEDRPAP